MLYGTLVSIEGRELSNCEGRTFAVQPCSLVGRLRVESGLWPMSESTQSPSGSLKQRPIPMHKEGEWTRIAQHALELPSGGGLLRPIAGDDYARLNTEQFGVLA